MIIENMEDAWGYIHQNATRLFEVNGEWYSPVKARKYVVHSVTPDQITILRDCGTETKIKDTYVRTRIREINDSNGRISRTAIDTGTAKLAAFIQFMQPILSWTADGKEIVVVNSMDALNLQLLSKRPDYETISRLMRSGQPKFRKDLMDIYNSRCSISGTTLSNVIDAAHVVPHSDYYDYSVENGVLLRADLHNLFDDGMIAIDPDTLIITVHPDLINDPDYGIFNNKAFIRGKDNAAPSRLNLNKKWENKKWSQ